MAFRVETITPLREAMRFGDKRWTSDLWISLNHGLRDLAHVWPISAFNSSVPRPDPDLHSLIQ